MGFFQSRFLTLVIMILSCAPARAQQSLPAIEFQFFPDSGLNVVCLTLGKHMQVRPADQAAIHLLEYAWLQLPQPAFNGRSLQKHLERKGVRCETEVRHHSLSFKAASATVPAAEMLTDMILALSLDSVSEPEVKKLIAEMNEEADRAAELPGWLLQQEVNARICPQAEDCINIAPAFQGGPAEAQKRLAAGWQRIIPGGHCLVSVKGKCEPGEIRGLAENGLGSQLRQQAPLMAYSFANHLRNQYFTLLNENAIVPEMQLTWVVSNLNLQRSATAWLAAAAIEARLRDLSFLPFESCRSEVHDLNGMSLVSLHLVPQARRISALADSLPAMLNIWLNTEKWTDELISRARASLRIRRDLAASNPFHFALPPDTLDAALDRISRDEVMAFVQQNLHQGFFIAGLSLNSAVDAMTGAEELFARANERPAETRDFTSAISQPDTPAVAIAPPDFSKGMDDAVTALKKVRIYFEPNSSQPDAASIQALHNVAEWMKAHPEWRLFVNGYADSRGDGVKNYQLTIERAGAIKLWLINREGLAADRLIVRPWGEAFPEFEETSPENIRRNRRVTFDPASADEPIGLY